jgi:hypothetical protein
MSRREPQPAVETSETGRFLMFSPEFARRHVFGALFANAVFQLPRQLWPP